MSLEIRRSGNLIEVVGGAGFEYMLEPRLSYWHRVHYRGQVLRERQRTLQAWKIANDPRAAKFRPNMDLVRMKLYQIQGPNLACPAGLKSRVTALLDSQGVLWNYVDLRSRKLPPMAFNRLAELPGGLQFRHRQDEVLTTIDGTGMDNLIIVAPTGYGKSHLARLLAAVYPKSNLLFITPGLDVVRGFYEAMQPVVPAPDLGLVTGSKHQPDRRVVVCSLDSVHKTYMSRADLIVGDEVHEFGAAEAQKNLCGQFTEAKWLGLSASFPCRGDGADDVVEAMFGPKTLEISYQEAAEHKAVTPLCVLVLEIGPIPGYSNLTDDPDAWARKAYWRNDVRNKIYAEFLTHGLGQYVPVEDPQILCMVETIDHAFELRKHLPDYRLVYAVQGDQEQWSKRKKQFANRKLWKSDADDVTDAVRNQLRLDFQAGTLRRAISTHCWAQGVNFVQLSVLARLDGATAKNLNIQIPGRLSRLSDGKEYGFLVDSDDGYDDKAAEKSQRRIAFYASMGWKIIRIPVGIQTATLFDGKSHG